MPELGSLVRKVRSKNAGPFWLTIDVFCGSEDVFGQVRSAVRTEAVADLFQVPAEHIKRFESPDLHVLKFSLPRPVVQGAACDRDMHGAAWASLLAELDLAGVRD